MGSLSAYLGAGEVGIDISAVVAYFVALSAILLSGVLLFRLFKVPAKILGKLALNSILGGIALFACNFILSLFGLSIALNIFNAAFVGVLGVPGLVTLIILRFIL